MRKKNALWVTLAIGVALIILADYHWNELRLQNSWLLPLNILAFLYFAGTLITAAANKSFTFRRTNKLKICVVIPIYNEDPKTFSMVLESLRKQTLLPSMVYVIDDASPSRECAQIFKIWSKTSGICAKYTRNKQNIGKRQAQAVAFRFDKTADVFVTIDSDTVLDKKALKNGLRPFGEPRVMSVAGLLVGLNENHNLLTRLVDLGFVSSFINGRAAWSRLRSVAVNCGGLAFYRASVVRKYLDEYLNQTVFGKKAAFGDDRMLTNLALLEGWTVFQDTSIGYTVLPENFSHLIRQRIRWWRSFFWGGIWLIRRFSPTRLVWWLVTWQFVSFIFYTIVLVALFISTGKYGTIPWVFLIYISIATSYIHSARFLLVDVPKRKQSAKYLTFLLSPLSTLLHMFLCSALQYAGLFSVHKSGWGTRKKVEVTL